MATPNIPFSPAQGIKKLGSPTSGERQTDFEISNDGRGLLESSLKFYFEIDSEAPEIPSGVPKRGSPHPVDSRLKCYKVSTSFGKNDIGYCQADYIGLLQDPTEGEWELSSSSSDSSMIFHKKFEELAMEQKGEPATEGTVATPTIWKKYIERDENNNFVRFMINAPDNLGGIESFVTPSSVCRVTFYSAKAGTMLKVMQGLSQTRSVPLGAPATLATSDGTNWMLTNASVSEYGTIYRMQTEWTKSSGGLPHNPKIYDAFPE